MRIKKKRNYKRPGDLVGGANSGEQNGEKRPRRNAKEKNYYYTLHSPHVTVDRLRFFRNHISIASGDSDTLSAWDHGH